jgi:GT2 family glycosyltransferase
LQDRAKASIVIPNWNGEQHLPMVLSSMEKQTFRDFDITVVDDGSTDGSVDYLRSEWPAVRVVQLPENLGFASAWARGVEESSGEYVVIINNDIEFEADWLGTLVAEMDADPSIGFITTKILFKEDRDVVYGVGHDFYVYGWCATKGLGEKDVGQYDHRSQTSAATGAGSMFRRAALDRAGGVDADYWMYCEDVDLGLRILLQGYRGVYLPRPVGYHVGGATMGEFLDTQRFHLWRNQLITLAKDVPAGTLWRALPKVLLFHYYQFSHERRGGGSPWLVLKAYAAFIKALPKTLGKRRRVQRSRRASPAEFRAQLHSEYPFPTRFGRLVGQAANGRRQEAETSSST